MKQIDARGLSCPEPVLRVQNALRTDAAGLIVTVSNAASVENIKRFANARGYSAAVEENGADYTLTLTKG